MQDSPEKTAERDVVERLSDKAWNYADGSPNNLLTLDAVFELRRLRQELEAARAAPTEAKIKAAAKRIAVALGYPSADYRDFTAQARAALGGADA